MTGIVAILSAPGAPAAADEVHEVDDADELAAYRSGYMQLAWDSHTERSPHLTGDDYASGEPVTQVQYSYNDVPAWICAGCTRVTLAPDEDTDATCRACGSDALEYLFMEEPCEIEEHW